jgi:peptide/nickel transport system permease protein
MVRYVARRLVQAVPTFLGITLLSYLLMLGAPGGPVAAMTFDPKMSPAEREAVAARLGVNDPFPIQYLRWLLGDDWMRWDTDDDGLADRSFLIPLDADGNGVAEEPGTRKGVLRGDFGTSFFQKRPVMKAIGELAPATLELGIAGLIVGVIVGVPVGILSAVNRGGWFDNITRVVAGILNSVPVFWLGLILILIFGSQLRLLPMGGRCPTTISGGCPPIYERLGFLILPTFVLATGGIAGFSRYMRASMLEVIGQDYIRTARAKGLSPRSVWFRHGARNALIPLATFLGPAITGLLGGAVITETIFSWPGLGRLGVSSVTSQDYPMVMAIVILGAIATILGYLLSDVLYALIDPRIRLV